MCLVYLMFARLVIWVQTLPVYIRINASQAIYPSINSKSMRNTIPWEFMFEKREFNTGNQSIIIPNTKATNVFNPLYLVFEKIRGCIQSELWERRMLYVTYIILYFGKCALLDASYNESHFSLNKSAHIHSLINHITESIIHIGIKEHIPNSTHAHSIYRVCCIMWLPCSIAWAKSFSSLLNNYSVNSLNRISIDKL